MKFFKKKTALLTLCKCYLAVTSMAQSTQTVGSDISEKILNMEFKEVKNYPKSEYSLSAFKSKKLILLDFWSKHCSVCIAAMPKIQQLQLEFNDHIQFILVTANTKKELEPLFQKSKILTNNTLPMIFADTVLNKLFPHTGEPFYVWLSPSGKLITTTKLSEINKTNIENYVLHNKITAKASSVENNKPMPDGLDAPTASILTVEDGKLRNKIIYFSNHPGSTDAGENKKMALYVNRPLREYSVFMSNLPLYQKSDFIITKDENGKPNGIRFFQIPILSIIERAYEFEYSKADHQLIIVDKSAKNVIKTLDEVQNVIDFEKINRITYESHILEFSYEKAMSALKKDLKNCFGLVGELKKVPIPLIILSTIQGSNTQIKSKNDIEYGEVISTNNETEFKNATFKELKYHIQSSYPDHLLVDNTGIDDYEKVQAIIRKISLNKNTLRVKYLKDDLKKYGIRINTEEKLLNTFVIKKIN